MADASMSENSLLSLLATVVIGLAVLVGWCAGGAASDFVEANRAETQATPRTPRIPLSAAAQAVPATAVRAPTAPPVKTRREPSPTAVPATASQFEASR